MNWNYDSIKKGISSAARVAATAVGRAAEAAKDLAEDLTSFKALKDYKLAGHVATAGPCATWRIFAAVSKKPGAVFPEVCVWILDKKTLLDAASRAGRVRAFDAFFEQQRRACAQMQRVKHPGVVRVVEPLEESAGQMVLVTEPVFGSLHNVLTAFRDVPTAPEGVSSTKLSELELKHGLCALAEALQFLHGDARLAHGNVNPETVIIGRDGGWRLAGFAFVDSADGYGSGGGAGGTGGGGGAFEFDFSGAGSGGLPLWDQVLVPPLAYTAPERVYGSGGGGGGSGSGGGAPLPAAADVFSLALIAYEALTGKPLVAPGATVAQHRAAFGALTGPDVGAAPAPLQALLRAMLAPSPAARPSAAAFASAEWFQGDMALRALRFLDTMLQRDAGQKAAFLRDLATFWRQFDARLLRHRVLPPVVAELRTGGVGQLAALPLVLAIMGATTPEDFQASGILPALRPVFETADGELLLALVRNAAVFQRLMPRDATAGVLVPLLLRACDSNSPRAQEEVLRSVQALAGDVQYEALAGALVPKVVAMALRTTSLVAPTAALGMLAGAARRLDRDAAERMLDVAGQIAAVDKSAGTALAVLRLADAVSSHFGADATAARALPLACPLLATHGFTAGQFAAAAAAVDGMLARVKEKRVGELGAAAPVPLAAPALPPAPAPAGAPAVDFTGGGGGGGGAIGSGTWDVPLQVAAPARPPPAAGMAAAAGAAAAASAMAAASWDSFSTAAPAAPIGGTGGGLQQQSPRQQQQQQQQQARPAAGISAGMAAPDIFGGSGGLAASSSGTSLAAASPTFAGAGGGGGGSGARSAASDVADIFGSLGVADAGASQQQQQQQRVSLALRPPPSAKGSAIGAAAAAAAASDPFAGLNFGGGTSTAPAAAAAAAPIDPFDALAAGTGPAPADPFAGLLGAGSNGNVMRPPAQQQQQQSAWPNGGSSSLI